MNETTRQYERVCVRFDQEAESLVFDYRRLLALYYERQALRMATEKIDNEQPRD